MPTMSWAQYAEEAQKSGSFDPLPVGVYNIRVDTAEVKDTKSEHKGLLTRLVVTDGPLVGRSILNNMNPYKNDGDPNPYFMQTMSAFGLGINDVPEFWQSLDTMDHEQSMLYIAQTLLGREATITVSHRMYNNEIRDNVKKIQPKGQAMPQVQAAPGAPGLAQAPAAAPMSAPTAPPVPQSAPAPVAPAPAPAPAPVPAAPAPAPAPVPVQPEQANPVQVPPVVPPSVPEPVQLPDEAPF